MRRVAAVGDGGVVCCLTSKMVTVGSLDAAPSHRREAGRSDDGSAAVLLAIQHGSSSPLAALWLPSVLRPLLSPGRPGRRA